MAVATKRNFLFSVGIRKWAYNLSGWNQYGLHRDDIIRETPIVQEALRRIPQDKLDARNFRIIRAMQLCCQKVVLPKEEWVKFEEDDKYLMPYIEEVEREMKEKEEWNKT